MTTFFSIRQLRDKFFGMSAREQFMAVLVVGVGIYFMFESLVLTPQDTRHAELTVARAQADSQVIALRAEILAVSKSNLDIEKVKLENAQLKRQVTLLNAVLASTQVKAPQIGELVKGVIQDYPHVTLGSLRTLPVTALVSAPPPRKTNAAAPATTAPPESPVAPQKTIYRHGVEVEIHGNYLDLLAYLKNLEASTQHVFWSDAKLNALKYPESSLRLTIFVLSDQPILKFS